MIMISILIQISYCTIVGIDLGSDSIKVAVGSRNKPVHLVKNLYSHEATPNVFSYIDQYHWSFGEEAIEQCQYNPNMCIQNQRVPLNNQLYFTGSPLKGYQIVALSLIQILQNVKDTENIKDDIKVVIAIPPSMTNREKSYLYTALVVSGINCIQFVTSTYAPIETYVNEHKFNFFSDKKAVLIDIGHEGVRVSGFEFDSSRITQKFGLYNDNIGGKTVDDNLLKLVLHKYALGQHYGADYSRDRAVLLSKIRKAREELTDTKVASFYHNSKYVSISRRDVDKCCGEIRETLDAMVRSLLKDQPRLARTGNVYLIGGCSRIPGLQKHITKLLPNAKQIASMDAISSVCKGACYAVNDEIRTEVKIHDALVTTEVVLKVGGNLYKLFSYENTENFNPVVRLTVADSLHTCRVVDKDDNDQEFTRFTINVPRRSSSFYSDAVVDIGFTLNYFLMPVPDRPMLVQAYDGPVPLSVNSERVGWEIPTDEMVNSKAIINSMAREVNKKARSERKSNLIEQYKMIILEKLKDYGLTDWRKFVFAKICNIIESSYNSCLDNNDNHCSVDNERSILRRFKSLVSTLLDIDENVNNEINYNVDSNSERNRSIDQLYDLINSCKIFGVKYEDVEQWIKSKFTTATMKEIYEYIGVLKERVKQFQNYYN